MKKLLIATGIYPPDIGGPATYAKLLADHWGTGAKIVTYTPFLRAIPMPLRQIIFFFRLLSASRGTKLIYALSPLGTGVAAALAGRPFALRVAGDRVWEDAINAGRTHLLLDDFQKTSARFWKRRLQTWVCAKAKAVIVPSQYLADLVAGWGIPREKIKIVPNAVDFPKVKPQENLPRFNLGISGHLILSVGRLVPWKGFRMLIKIMPQLLEINQFFRLIIIGDGPDMKFLKTIVNNLNLKNKVFLIGKKSRDETVAYLRSAKIMILNSGYEGFSHALLEAMVAGLPVIASSAGGNRELVRQGENGFLVKYNDEFNIVEAVKTLWSSKELQEKFIAGGRKTAAEYSPERTISETIKALDI